MSGWLPAVRSHLPCGFGSIEDILKRLESHSEYDVYSFDIFDTLLRRRIEPPELIKQLAAEYLAMRLSQRGIPISPDAVLAQRSRCEQLLLQQALAAGKDADYCLDDVMTETVRALKADSVLDSREIVSYEIRLEEKAAQPMPGAVELLSYVKSMGKSVICLSDSYLSANQMTAILESQGLVKYVDKLYVSCEIGKRKSTGRLFQHVLGNERGKLVHIGDNYTSDYAIPKKLGIKSLWLHSRSEQKRKGKLRKLRERRNKMDYVNAVIKHADDGESALHRIGYEVFGPALTVFIHNVVEQAKKDGVEMLFFVARDGYVMKKVYEALQHTIYVNSALPPGRYMCLGRLPVRLASLHELSYAQIMDAHAYISWYQGENVSLKDILVSYGLEPDGFVDIAKQYGLDLNEPIINPAGDERLHKLLGSNELKEIVGRKSAEAKELLRKYLVGIGFIGEKRVAVVDATAEGLTQTILDIIFSDDVNYPAVRRYYFNLLTLSVGTAVIKPELSEVIGIVSDWRRDSISDRKLFALFGLVIELFSHPNHGVTVGYKEVDGKVVPVFRKTSQETQYKLTSQGLRGILSYARDYVRFYSLHRCRAEELLPYAKRDVKKWAAYPPIDDVKALRYSFVTSDWPRESDSKLIQKIEVGDIIRVGRFRKKLGSSLWFQGTLALAPIPGLNCLLYRVGVCRDRFRRVGKIENQDSL